MVRLFLVGILVLLVSACSGTIPAEYSAQSYIKVGQGQLRMGEFVYAPVAEGKIKSNQIQNTAIGSLYMAEDVADLVKRATALEFERSGLTVIDRAQNEIRGDIYEFKADDLGFSVDWTYKIKYGLYDTATGDELLSNIYEADPKRTGKFGLPSDFTPSINQMIRNALEKFMADVRNLEVFKAPADIASK